MHQRKAQQDERNEQQILQNQLSHAFSLSFAAGRLGLQLLFPQLLPRFVLFHGKSLFLGNLHTWLLYLIRSLLSIAAPGALDKAPNWHIICFQDKFGGKL